MNTCYNVFFLRPALRPCAGDFEKFRKNPYRDFLCWGTLKNFEKVYMCPVLEDFVKFKKVSPCVWVVCPVLGDFEIFKKFPCVWVVRPVLGDFENFLKSSPVCG